MPRAFSSRVSAQERFDMYVRKKGPKMKIILLQDVKSLGKEGDIVNVSDGYARNFVIPKKLGVEANDKNKNDLKLKNQREAKEAAERLADAQKLAQDLE